VREAQVIHLDDARPGRSVATRRTAAPASRGGTAAFERCQAVTAGGNLCRNHARANGFCAVHQPPPPGERIGPFDETFGRGYGEEAGAGPDVENAGRGWR